MTTLLRREARVACGALTGVGDTGIPTAAAAIHGRTGAGPVTLRASRIAPIDLDPKSGIAGSSRLPGLGAGCWAWQEHAACKGMDSSCFFPPDRERATTAAARIAGAKKVCADCPVLVECRAFALRVREPYGVWGGLSEQEREEIRGLPADTEAHPDARPGAHRPFPPRWARPVA